MMTVLSKLILSMVVIFVTLDTAIAQNPLVIPPALTGTNFNLTV
jgi:hypothetical protein